LSKKAPSYEVDTVDGDGNIFTPFYCGCGTHYIGRNLRNVQKDRQTVYNASIKRIMKNLSITERRYVYAIKGIGGRKVSVDKMYRWTKRIGRHQFYTIKLCVFLYPTEFFSRNYFRSLFSTFREH
jgi:hypothetical protein